MAVNPLLKGLFDRPINETRQVPPAHANEWFIPGSGGTGDGRSDINPCGFGYFMDVDGFCKPVGEGPTYSGGFPISTGLIFPIDNGTQNSTTILGQGSANVTVNTAVNVSEQVVTPIANAITDALDRNQKIINDTAATLENAITKQIQEDTDAITAGIRASHDNLTSEVEVVTGALAASTAATVGTVAAGINSEITAVKNTITPILTSISGFIHDINVEVQKINDTFIQPLTTLYNSTIGTIATLTTAIEQDLKDGIGGLLHLPSQLAEQLGSFDASLQRTVEQLGSHNKEVVTTGIDYLSSTFPKPFSDILSSALAGKTLTNSLATTYTDRVTLTTESLEQVSKEAIGGLGHLLEELLKIVTDTFGESLKHMHANWGDAKSIFVGLLDGALSLLTTLTAMGALAGPLIEAAEEEAHALIPITKLDPASVIEALRRGFLTTEAAFKELRTKGIDQSRSQVLIDLSVFFADANQALDWWYRGIIADEDLISNLTKHGFKTEDITAYKQGSINLPALGDLLRWKNFGIITEAQFIHNAKAIRYDDAQITAILATYRDRETPQTLSQLSGLLDNSSIGFLNGTLNREVPDNVKLAGERAGYHPDLTRYIWLNHWTLPPVETFIQLYFRGVRTKTELDARMSIANIPQELWDDLIKANRSLIPYRSIPSFVSRGFMNEQQAQDELAAHGFDLTHQQIILKAIKPPVEPTNTAAISTIHTLSQQNARTLWADGAITDKQYTDVLEAHGYTPETAALQIKSDTVTEHIKKQKAQLADVTAQVLAGVMTQDDAIVELNTDGFTTAQISKFITSLNKQQKVNTKIPSIPELNKFLKAELITLDDYTNALQLQGWQEPWLSAFLGLISKDGVAAGQVAA